MTLKNHATLLGISMAAVCLGAPAHAKDEYLAPTYKPNPALAPIVEQIKPGGDLFKLEKPAEEIWDRLNEIGAALRKDKAAASLAPFLAEGFSGTSLRPGDETPQTKGAELQVFRASAFPEAALDAAAFQKDF